MSKKRKKKVPEQCAVCGVKRKLTRHHLIPQCYLKAIKAGSNPDIPSEIIKICAPCHQSYEDTVPSFRKSLEREHGIVRTKQDIALQTINNLVVYRCSLLTDEQLDENMEFLRTAFGSHLTMEDIPEIWKKRVATIKRKKQTNNERMVYNVDSYQDFARRWRAHFIVTMNPKFMPDELRIKGIHPIIDFGAYQGKSKKGFMNRLASRLIKK